MARVALLIGSTQYQKGFQPLPAVAENLQRLAAVLGNPEIGGFEVETLLDPDHGQMRVKLETWLRQRQKDDVSLLYLTGHGVKDRERKLHFAATDTSKPDEELITSTALAAADLRSYLRQSKASKQVVILDCCFSGAFGDLVAMDDGSVDVEAALLEPERPGRVVLASSSSMQYSFVEEGAELSLYTQYLLEGLETGAADANDDEAITADEIHRYVSRKVTEVSSSMTPKIFVLKDEGYQVRIAKVPMGDPKVRYRKEVEAIVQEDDGEISFINRECLQLLTGELIPFGFTAEQAEAIEQQVLEPIRQRQEKEQNYSTIFAKALEQNFPFNEREKLALQRLRKQLGLRDSDYKSLEKNILSSRNSSRKASTMEDLSYFDIGLELRKSINRKQYFISSQDFSKATTWLNKEIDIKRSIKTIFEKKILELDSEFLRIQEQKSKELSEGSASIEELIAIRKGEKRETEILSRFREFSENLGFSRYVVSELLISLQALPIESDNLDYSNLRDSLRKKQWKEADLETYKLLKIGAQDYYYSGISKTNIKSISCLQLIILDKLWSLYSNGKFGFSIWTRRWKEHGEPTPADKLKWEDFLESISWKDQKSEAGSFSLANFHIGQLPSLEGELFVSIDLAKEACSQEAKEARRQKEAKREIELKEAILKHMRAGDMMHNLLHKFTQCQIIETFDH